MSEHTATTGIVVHPKTQGGRRSTLIAFLGSVASLALPLLGSTTLPTPLQWLQVAINFVGDVATYWVPNLPSKYGRLLKAATTFVVAVLSGLPVYVVDGWDGLTGASLLIVVVKALSSIGVALFPNDTVAPEVTGAPVEVAEGVTLAGVPAQVPAQVAASDDPLPFAPAE